MRKSFSNLTKMFALMLVMGTQTATAEETVSMRDMGHFAVGLDVMYNSINVKYATNYVDTIVNNKWVGGEFDEESITHHYNKLSPAINLDASYIYKNIYLGLAGEIIIGSSQTKDDFDFLTLDESEYSKIQGFAYGIKGKVGCFVDKLNMAIYGIVGIRSRSMKLWNDSYFEFNEITIKKPAMVIGLGMEKPIYKNLTVCAEYEHAWRKHNRVMSAGVPGAENGDTTLLSFNFNTNYRENSFRIGVKYHF